MALAVARPFRTLLPQALAAVFALLLLSAAAAAQQDGSASASGQQSSDGGGAIPPGAVGASVEQLQGLVDTLQSDADRRRLVQQLEALIAAKRAETQGQGQGEGAVDAPSGESAPDGLGSRLLQGIGDRMDAVRTQLGQAVDTLERIPAAARDLWAGLQRAEVRERWLDVAVNLLLILGGAVLAERLAQLLLRAPRRRLAQSGNGGLPMRTLLLLSRTLLDGVAIVFFAGAAYGLIAAVEPDDVPQLVALTLINASLLSRVLGLAGRAALAPHAPSLRLPRLPDETAVYLYIWLRRLGVTAIYGYFATEALVLLGVGAGAQAALQKLVGLAVAALLIVFLLQNRKAVARWLRGGGDGPAALRGVRSRLAELWHLLAVAYVLAVYGVWALEVEGGFSFLARATVLTVAVLVGARVLNGALERTLDHGFRLSEDLRQRYPGLEARANRYLPGLRRFVRGGLAVLAGLLLLQVWGAGVLSWLTSGVGQQVIGRLATVAMLLGLAFALWEVLSAVVERVLTKSTQRDSAKRSARLATLLPLLRNAVRILLIVVVSLIVLSELGVDIGPLLAGAGVIGLAVGFGAQTLVKDVITGVFILIEDSLAVGDWVDLGGHGGEVESMTIRTIQLRDLHGHVHVVPFSDVTSILNMARDYGYAVIDVAVALRENTDAVIQLLQQVADELRQDADWGPKLIGDLEVFGVNEIGESAVQIRVRLKTQPLEHWGVRREFLRRTKQLFDEQGVEIPYPHRTLYFGVDKTGAATPARVALQQPPRETAEPDRPDTPRQTSSTTPTDDPDGEG